MVLAHEQPLRTNSINAVFHQSIGGSAGNGTHGGDIPKPDDMPPREAWTHEVTTPEGLIDAVTTENAVVGYTEDIDMTGHHGIEWASNVTLVGGYCDPSVDGRGPVIKTDYYQDLFVSCYHEAPSLYGVSLRGPNTNYFDPRSDERTQNDVQPEDWYAGGLHCYDSNGIFEAIGCEFWGWSLSGLLIGAKNHLTEAVIDRCSFHHNQMETLGYGVEHYNGEMTITKSFFDACRHGVSSFGYKSGSYAIAQCVFGPNEWRGHLQDMHGLANNVDTDSRVAGGYMNSYQNTYLGNWDAGNLDHPDGYAQEAIAIRGVPDQSSYVDKCHFPNHEEVDHDTYPNEQGQAIRQETEGWTNFEIRDNRFKGDGLEEGYGAPRTDDGTKQPPDQSPKQPPEKPANDKPSDNPSTTPPTKQPTEETITINGVDVHANYELTVDGDIAVGERSEGNETITTNDDGTTTVTGYVTKYADSFTVAPNTTLVSLRIDNPLSITRDDESVDIAPLVGTAVFEDIQSIKSELAEREDPTMDDIDASITSRLSTIENDLTTLTDRVKHADIDIDFGFNGKSDGGNDGSSTDNNSSSSKQSTTRQ